MIRIEIPYSRIKLVIGTVFSLLFIIGGFFMIFSINSENILYNLFIKIFGILGVLFFGTTCGFGAIKLFDNKPGLIIDDSGIIDNSNMSSIGLIGWADIKEIKVKDYSATSFLLIFLYDNDKYLVKANGFKHRLLKANFKKYKTPISIISNTLDCNFDELVTEINDTFRKSRG